MRREQQSDPVRRLFSAIPEQPRLTPEVENDLVRRTQDGDQEAAKTLVEAHLRYVAKLVFPYRNLGVPMEDLIHEGTLGLIQATQRFEAQRGYRFLTYAQFWIRRSILETLRRDTNLVRMPGSAHRRAKQQTQSRTSQPTPPGPKLGRGAYVSLDSWNDCSTTPPPRLPGEWSRVPDSEGELLKGERRGLLRDAIRDLSPSERDVISRRFGLDGERAWTLQEIGDSMGKTRERIRQIEVRAKGKLHGAITRRYRRKWHPWRK